MGVGGVVVFGELEGIHCLLRNQKIHKRIDTRPPLDFMIIHLNPVDKTYNKQTNLLTR